MAWMRAKAMLAPGPICSGQGQMPRGKETTRRRTEQCFPGRAPQPPAVCSSGISPAEVVAPQFW